MGESKKTHVRYLIISILFAVSCFSYGDRVALSIAGTAMGKDILLDPVKLGYLFSGFSWAYVLGQLPSGAMLDRFGSKLVYGIGIVVWSVCALLTGFAGYLASKRDVLAALKPGTARSYDSFARCRSCAQVYWRGAHARRLDQLVCDAERVTER